MPRYMVTIDQTNAWDVIVFAEDERAAKKKALEAMEESGGMDCPDHSSDYEAVNVEEVEE